MYKFSLYLLAIFLLLTFGATAQTGVPIIDTNTGMPVGYDTMLQSSTYVDNVVHVYDSDSLDRMAKIKEHSEFLRMSAMQASSDKLWMKRQIGALSMRNMSGRGYVKHGVDSAALYIMRQFKSMRLRSVAPNGAFLQGFAYPINTFPGKMKLVVNGDSLRPGMDYLIDPASPSLSDARRPAKTIDLNNIADAIAWKLTLAQLDGSHAWRFNNLDIFCNKVLHVNRQVFLAMLPPGCYIIPQAGHLQWGVSRDTIAATIFYVHPDVLPKNLKSVAAAVTAEFIPRFRNRNIIASVPGVVKDSFIVFSAHYDDLGMMGSATDFPGASSDASGIAMMLHLASFYSKHTPHYTIVFIAFAGEEASLMGSEFFVKYSMLPLKNIKFLINMDFMGDATHGITVVNATEDPEGFDLLKKINDREKFLPEVRSRGPAANSDHYYFARAGVPAFFIYGNGTRSYYNEVYDMAKEITENKVDGVARLLISFANELN